MKNSVEKAYVYAKKFLRQGKVADYIPELSVANPDHLGISITNIDGEVNNIGEYSETFTIQSIGKVIALAVALEECGAAEVFKHVGMEATGDPFNSIIRLETDPRGLPANPMVNSGAISVCACIKAKTSEERFEKIFNMAKKMLGNPDITINEEVYKSEIRTGDRNRSLAYMMSSCGIFDIDVEELLDVYFKLCSINVSCDNLSYMGALLANNGKDIYSDKKIIHRDNARIIRALMLVAGNYDVSGTFAVQIGFPGKSGVGGGIVGVVPGKMGIGVYSPGLDPNGNSMAGKKALEYLSKELDLFVY